MFTRGHLYFEVLPEFMLFVWVMRGRMWLLLRGGS